MAMEAECATVVFAPGLPAEFLAQLKRGGVIHPRRRAQRAEGGSVWRCILPGVLPGDSQSYHETGDKVRVDGNRGVVYIIDK